jgi:hypothetical protein
LLIELLQHIDVTVARAVLVAGYCTQPDTSDARPRTCAPRLSGAPPKRRCV